MHCENDHKFIDFNGLVIVLSIKMLILVMAAEFYERVFNSYVYVV